VDNFAEQAGKHSGMPKPDEPTSAVEARLDEVANLLGAALQRARARKANDKAPEGSTGRVSERERVFTPENGL
jgi:hypothetical protein